MELFTGSAQTLVNSFNRFMFERFDQFPAVPYVNARVRGVKRRTCVLRKWEKAIEAVAINKTMIKIVCFIFNFLHLKCSRSKKRQSKSYAQMASPFQLIRLLARQV